MATTKTRKPTKKKTGTKAKAPTETKTLDFIFWGIACFWKEPGHYRVLLPDGRPNGLPSGVRPHMAEVWFRPKDIQIQRPPRWKPFADQSFRIDQPYEMVVDGITSRSLTDDELFNYLPSLTVADPNFRVSKNPGFILDTTIDRGTLSAHQLPDSGDNGSIYVQWHVEFDDHITLRFGAHEFIVPGDITQVIIANIADTAKKDVDNDFRLYRVLTDDREGKLSVCPPKNKPPQNGNEPEHPPHSRFHMLCPFIDCSGAGYWYP
jgi:hypothetical protein